MSEQTCARCETRLGDTLPTSSTAILLLMRDLDICFPCALEQYGIQLSREESWADREARR